MGFFQSSVINKHLKVLDKAVVNAAYAKFKECFHNPEIQYNIREAKEEQFQEGFLRELFVKVLGYTLNPQPNYNLTTELKNEKGANKADGAILKDGKALAVIELKGTDTKDLDKINTQAFNYKNNQTGCIYVVTSNFEKLRFFIHNSVDHLEFNLFTLTEQEFELLWLCLSVDCLLGSIPLKVKEESLLAEENVTKQLYKDYAAFRIDLWQNMVKNRPEVDQLLLFKKTQKLLDRFLFIFFAEDSGLLPPNSISRIVKRWNVLQEEDAYKPLYDIFNQYFGYINTGRKGKTPQDDIFAYDGGLFFSDEVLDNIVIDDDVLQPHVMRLTAYDFQSEIDVNILGHIFENSLSEIENVIAKLEGKEVDKNKTKRKKEGVFYTPKYITKYIVDNTVGKLCEEKKSELGIVDEEYTKGRRNRKKETIKKLDKGLQAYRKWLLDITICDPACGSGAFLNQALEYLIAEHIYIDELTAQLLGRSIVFHDVSNHILEKNIYGVDINEESVDIAKLSLWLRTAQKGRKLTTLNNNLKCGNSLIDDPEVAGEKAFIWQEEFPKVFENGGFDIIIGNPPYVQLQKLGDESKKLQKMTFETYEPTGDLYALFYENGLKLLRGNGILSFITGSAWLRSNYGKSLRKFFLEKTELIQVIDFSDCKIFDDATVLTSIVMYKKNTVSTQKVNSLRLTKKDQQVVRLIDNYFESNKTIIESFRENSWVISNKDEYPIKLKVEKQGVPLKEWGLEIFRGILTGYNEAFILDEDTKNKLVKEHPSSSNLLKPILRGRDIERYKVVNSNLWLLGTFPSLEIDIDQYPAINKYLEQFGKKIHQTGEAFINEEGKNDKSRKKTSNKWFETQDTIAYYDVFEKDKIIYPNMTKFLPFVLDKQKYYTNQKCFLLSGNHLEYLVCFFNSRLFKFCFEEYFPELQGNTREMNKVIFQELPVKIISDSQNEIFKLLSDEIHSINSELDGIVSSLNNLLLSKFNIESVSNKLQNWQELKFGEFLKELENARKKAAKKNEQEYTLLSLSEEAEWMQYFNEQKQKALELKAEIDRIDKEIDKMVYELYRLTNEEIEIIEQAV